MPLIDLKAHIQPSEGPVQWWKSLNRAIQQTDLRIQVTFSISIRLIPSQISDYSGVCIACSDCQDCLWRRIFLLLEIPDLQPSAR